ncbi:NmrA family NAD(P)-binding protein [candidate division KSB1 bacterium]|nr:NmrA family NAD(P)-binding protein [candidate division KSB1 bacterium]
MKIFITGATGQIGSVVTKKLVMQGHQVRCLIRSSSNLVLLKD